MEFDYRRLLAQIVLRVPPAADVICRAGKKPVYVESLHLNPI